MLHGKRIGFLMHPEEGHIVPTFALAKWLREREATIVYLGPCDYRELVEREGFAYVPLAEEAAPRGYFQAWARAKWENARGGADPPPDLRTLLVGLLTRSQSEAMLADHRLDLLCADALMWPFVLVAKRLGLPVVSLQTDGLRRLGRFALSPPREGLERAAPARARWTEDPAAGAEAPPAIDREMARTYGFPLLPGEDLADEEEWSVPELALGPRRLCEDPIGQPRSYLGLCVDLSRHQAPLDETQLDGRPLVYCSIGTNAHFYRTPERLLGEIVRALAGRDDLQLVLHAGALVEPSHLPPLPRGAILLRRAPQLRILERASFFITHGGFGALKEAVHFGVPMIVYPMWRDQFFNADTVRRLGIGIAGHPLKARAADVASSIDRLVHGPFRAAIDVLGSQITAARELETGVSVVVDALRSTDA